jgi:hypothetical protein
MKRLIVLRPFKTKGEVRLDDNESRFPALGAPMSPAWVHGSPHVEDLALPKILKKLQLHSARAVIRWMSVNITESVPPPTSSSQKNSWNNFIKLGFRHELSFDL